MTLSIFLKRWADDPSKDSSSNTDGERELRYFGHAAFAPLGRPNDREARSPNWEGTFTPLVLRHIQPAADMFQTLAI
jgi:hypothetical protein